MTHTSKRSTHGIDLYRIPKELKLTTKYTEDDRERVRNLYQDHVSINQIAREIPMSKRMVQFILFPERALIAKQNFAKRQKDGRYRYSTEQQSAMVRKVRERKKLIKDQLIRKT